MKNIEENKSLKILNNISFKIFLDDMLKNMYSNNFSLLIIKIYVRNGFFQSFVNDKFSNLIEERLNSLLGKEYLVFNKINDNIILIASSITLNEITILCNKLINFMTRPYLINDKIVMAKINIGVSTNLNKQSKAIDYINIAILALSKSKESRYQRFHIYNNNILNKNQNYQILLQDLQKSLILNQFELHYQPQVNLISGKLIGFEALIRWNHPILGLIPPSLFIPLAEEDNLIIQIGDWVIRKATQEAMSWPGELTVAVNVSAKQLLNFDHLLNSVELSLIRSKLPGDRLEIELTESSLIINKEIAMSVLNKLRSINVKVSIDDFGTGYSSLSQLIIFPFTKLKIDRSFIQSLSNVDSTISIVRTIISLGKNLKMMTIAEGVESIEQKNILMEEGCIGMQGYFISQPLPANRICDFIKNFGLGLVI